MIQMFQGYAHPYAALLAFPNTHTHTHTHTTHTQHTHNTHNTHNTHTQHTQHTHTHTHNNTHNTHHTQTHSHPHTHTSSHTIGIPARQLGSKAIKQSISSFSLATYYITPSTAPKAITPSTSSFPLFVYLYLLFIWPQDEEQV